jgi:formylglycine-generating enzyme required for sulfatase activity
VGRPRRRLRLHRWAGRPRAVIAVEKVGNNAAGSLTARSLNLRLPTLTALPSASPFLAWATRVRTLAVGLSTCFLVSTLADHDFIVDYEAGRYSFQMTASALAAEQGGTQAPKLGAEFRDCARCPAMVVIPAGRFTMGSPEDDPDARADERPRHEVTIAGPIAVSKFETTFDEWDACAAARACPQAPDHWGRGRMPAINVSWNDAKQYAAWLSQVTGQQYRLLTEAEWEFAARAGAATRYSWGNSPGEGEANCDGCGSRWDFRQTAPAGAFKPNAFGLHDMQGNVWEWVEDAWHDDYDGAPNDGSAWASGDPDYRVVRGGSWRNETAVIRAAIRDKRNIHVRFDTLGFRVARMVNLSD